MQRSFVFTDEINDLRKPPIKQHPAFPLAYETPEPPTKRTEGLPRGTQARFIEAAAVAAELGYPINTLLTVRWDSLFSDNDVNCLRTFSTPERIDRLVEHLRKWLSHRNVPAAYLWVREKSRNEGEHWHLAFHLPKRLSQEIVDFIATQTGEASATQRFPSSKRTEGEFARGEVGSWHLARDIHPERKGFYLAAYLGKGEPSEFYSRGRMVPNGKKLVRGSAFGGYEKDGKYDIEQGEIVGTPTRKNRFFIAKLLQSKSKKTAKRAYRLVSKLQTSIQGKGFCTFRKH